MITKHIHRQRVMRVYPWSRKTTGYETDSTAETIEEKLEMAATVIDELLERVSILEKKYESR